VSRKEYYYTYILRSGENITNSSTNLQIDISSECGEMSFGIARGRADAGWWWFIICRGHLIARLSVLVYLFARNMSVISY